MSTVTHCPETPPPVDERLRETPPENSAADAAAADAESGRIAFRGILLGLAAATFYSITNVGLRQLSDSHDGLGWDLWICGIKALPTVIIAGWMLVQDHRRGRLRLPSTRLVALILGTAVLMQFGGNFGFQLALRSIGLAISVPIVFASIICSGAIVGRVALGDPVGLRTGISMTLMVVSIGFLSAGAGAGGAGAVTTVSFGAVAWGVLCALVSGVSYGLGGVVIRRTVRVQTSVPLVLFLFGIVGVALLCPLGAWPMGLSGLQQISGFDWTVLLAAGGFNALGFFAITHALRLLTVNKANVVNAAQNAMCAVAGFVLFAEPVTTAALIGIGLTISGLLILGRR